jgi:uncharacterized OB-fold protein
MSDYAKPLPTPDEETQPWFDACKEHKLLLQYFPSADYYQFPYSDRCQADWSTEWEWRESKGDGEVYTWGLMHQVYHPAWGEEVPYVVAIVELDEGPRVNTTLVNVPHDQIKCGMRVKVTFDDVTDEISLPKFEPA